MAIANTTGVYTGRKLHHVRADDTTNRIYFLVTDTAGDNVSGSVAVSFDWLARR